MDMTFETVTPLADIKELHGMLSILFLRIEYGSMPALCAAITPIASQ